MRTANTPSENALSRSGVLLPYGTTHYHFRKLRIETAISSHRVFESEEETLPRGSPLLLDGETKSLKYPYGAALPALEVSGAKSLASGELISRA
jgi:hypothetical protein